MSESPAATMEQLRSSTRDEHDRAEHHEFQQALVRGKLSRERYADWLGQMYLVHSALETALRAAAEHSEAIRTVIHDYQYQVPYLLEDLGFFGVDTDSIEALPATRRFVSLVESNADDPILLLGLHYVLEGSNNGGRFIARHVAQAYDLEPGPGLRYLDPYGDRQREYWAAFKNDMTSVGFDAEQNDQLVAAAKAMYRSVAELSTDLAAAT